MEQILKKSHKKSWFDKFSITSNFATEIFSEKSNIIILQATVFGKDFVAEVVRKEDYKNS